MDWWPGGLVDWTCWAGWLAFEEPGSSPLSTLDGISATCRGCNGCMGSMAWQRRNSSWAGVAHLVSDSSPQMSSPGRRVQGDSKMVRRKE